MTCSPIGSSSFTWYVGTSRTIRLTLSDAETGDRINLAGATIYFMLGESTGSAAALIEKNSTGAEVTILDQTPGSATEGQVEVDLVPSESLALPSFDAEYVWNVLGELSSGKRVAMAEPQLVCVADTVGRIP